MVGHLIKEGFMNKPITVARYEYMQNIVNVTNNAHIPAFIKVEVLKQAIELLKPVIDAELKRDMDSYYQSEEVSDNGRPQNQ